jgi:hypothetical protein
MAVKGEMFASEEARRYLVALAVFKTDGPPCKGPVGSIRRHAAPPTTFATSYGRRGEEVELLDLPSRL